MSHTDQYEYESHEDSVNDVSIVFYLSLEIKHFGLEF